MLRLRVDRNPEEAAPNNFELTACVAARWRQQDCEKYRENTMNEERTFPLEPIGMVVDVSTCALLCLLSCY